MKTVRHALVAGLTLALAFTGLVAQPAAAAGETVTVNGVGSDVSEVVSLKKGLYELDFTYGKSSVDLQTAWLMTKDGNDEVPVSLVAMGFGDAGSSTRFIPSDGSKVWLDVSMSDGVAWSATFKPAKVPTSAVTSLSASGKGVNASKLFLLEKGTYSYSASYSDNQIGSEPLALAIGAMDLGGERAHLLAEKSASTRGTETGTFTITKRGVVWIDAILAPGASWKVEAKRLKNLTTAPTPKISGTAQVGKKLTAKPGTWKPSGVKLSYQWYRDGKKIKGATKSTYKLTASDKGKAITVKVKGKKSGYASSTKTSAKTKDVKAGVLSTTPTPKISGTAKVGKKLTAKAGTWSPADVKLSYQWYRNGTKIKDATEKTYKVSKSDKGKRITVKVKGKKSGYTSVTKTSKSTLRVR